MIINYLIAYVISLLALLIIHLSINKIIRIWLSTILTILLTTFTVMFIKYNYNRILENKVEYIIVDDVKALLQELPLNKDNYLIVLKYFEVKHPEDVLAQAILESGNFTSYNTKKRNNTLGLLHSSNKGKSNSLGYFKYNYWYECIVDYKTKIEYRLKEGEDYYEFLKRIGYAEDPKYVHKVKQVKNNLIKKKPNE